MPADLRAFVQRQLKIQLCDLVVHDKDLFIGERCFGILQAQQGIHMYVIPIGNYLRICICRFLEHKF